MRAAVSYILLFAVSFALALALSLPLDGIAARWIFPRVAERTGVTLTCRAARFSLPLSVLCEDVTASWAGGSATQDLESLRLTPGLGLFLGRRAATVETLLAGGRAALGVDGASYEIELEGVDLARFAPTRHVRAGLKGFLSARGRVEKTGEGRVGSLDISIAKPSLERPVLAGMDLPRIEAAELTARIDFEKDVVVVKTLRAEGGNVRLEGEGRIGPGNAIGSAPMEIRVRATPSASFREALGRTGSLIGRIAKPDGSLHIVLRGSPSSPEIGFE